MNVKGMKTSNQYHMILSRLQQVLTIIFLVILKTGANNDMQHFRKITESKCLSLPVVRTEYTTSVRECALRCKMNDMCGYFSYCNGPCKMYKLFYCQYNSNTECDCVSFFTLSENSTSWQKVFEMNRTAFKRSPVYSYWDILSIDKVKLILRKNNAEIHSLTFTGRSTDFRSWFNSNKLISKPWFGNIASTYEFNDKEENFFISPNTMSKKVMKAKKINEGTYIIRYNEVVNEFGIQMKYENVVVVI
ncbi:uncharacterized protein LOC118764577 [Octopus sinensis]|uniref:Uncharacterized protein LOC118764577 n=1 Tax=Octopus sinensis TaxID=2607531 RepID=A0A7E6F0I0_9MOLL|nr:uncharacterized protein LOC118764577 [Octopus sinensis]